VHPLTTPYAAARIVLGCTLVLAPGAVGRLWLGDGARGALVPGLLRVVGVRDLALGAAVLAARDDGDRRRLLALCAVADAVDAVVSAVRVRRVAPAGGVVGAVAAAAGAAVGAAAARRT
jgi:hypothetical protein